MSNKTIRILLLPLLLSATCFLVVVLCFDASQPPLPYTEVGHNMTKKRKKKKKTFGLYKKRDIFLTDFEKGTVISAVTVILAGLIVSGHISRGSFGPFTYPLLMSMYRVFLENNSTGVV